MQDGLYVTLSGQMALEKRMNTIADNVANMSTVGFRATGVRFSDLVEGTGASQVSFASTGEEYLSTQSGALRQTGNPLDFAVRGEGWFAIDTPAGMVLTRDGRFELNVEGGLQTLEGYPVLDAGGAPIQLDPNGGPPVAGADGSLRQGERRVGALGLFAHAPGADFKRFGNSGIIPQNEPEPIVDRMDAGVRQGFVEDANVNPVTEMMRLIQVQRAFEAQAAATRETENSFDSAVKTLASK
ncbi:flagellar basal-body rod protein FlgF [Mesorhizobium sp. RP14(2022)]|jgi:flagellar basal-body rod protein FlgF|uniref:Flagellar basal-body rod protein FlgF n=1 Tax=Mesorhizobium liriopis TaxID=2953882 RepID=A0ABT1CA09_9HYPH|nr:flagellar basal-body rod protein FlgF [Mesorhizobium liriopis]MCO6051016.1 flagellar basal-body rod protein FlgF [Mesorhizobium liriopis]